jgi:hypothetical protein
MGDLGRTGIQLVFTAVGSMFGPWGAAIGSFIGGVVGAELFPFDPLQGPRLKDLSIMYSEIGAPIPQLDGNARMGGNVIWGLPLREVADTETEGDFLGLGGQDITTYTYYGTWAVRFCEGEIGAVRKIWFDGKLVYDKSKPPEVATVPPGTGFSQVFNAALRIIAASESLADHFTFYSGSETQMPDPDIEADQGVGNTPAFRGICYIVFRDVLLTDYGNRLPQVTVELVKKPVEETNTIELWAAKRLEPWRLGGRDPRSPCGNYEYFWNEVIYDNLESAIGALEANLGRTLSRTIIGYGPPSTEGTFASGDVVPYSDVDESDIKKLRSVRLLFNEPEIEQVDADRFFGDTPVGGNGFNQLHTLGAELEEFVWWTGGSNFTGLSGIYKVANGNSPVPAHWDLLTHCIEDFGCPYAEFEPPQITLRFGADVDIFVRRKLNCPGSPCECDCDPTTPADADQFECPVELPENQNFCVTALGQVFRDIVYSTESGNFLQLQDANLADERVIRVPLGPVLKEGTHQYEQYNTEAFWTNAYVQARNLYPNDIEAGLIYGEDYPVEVSEACKYEDGGSHLDYEVTTLEEVVRRICLRHGCTLDDIDTTGLRKILNGTLTEEHVPILGYTVTRQSTGRAQIDQLRTFGQFDVAETGGKLKFVRRGLNAVATLDASDLGVFASGSSRPPALRVERQQDVEIPRMARVHYPEPLRDYQPDQQHSQRLVTASSVINDIELAIPMTSTEALRIADIVLYDAWAARNRYGTALASQWARLEPTDCIAVPVDGTLQRMRLLTADYAAPGLTEVALVRDDQDVYVSDAVGIDLSQLANDIALRGPTQVVLLDIPALRPEDDDAGYYVAVRGMLDGWSQAVIYRSHNDGDSYQSIGLQGVESIIGTATNALASGPTTIWDEGNTLTIALPEGALATATEAEVYNGANLVALGQQGRWELLQFQTATLNGDGSYTLSRLLRGRKGTEHNVGSHVGGDRFVLLTALARYPLSLDYVGQSTPHKGVTVGTPLANAPALPFTPAAVALEPFSPANLRASHTAGGDIELSWQWRNRFTRGLRAGVSVPLTETAEAGEVDVLIGGTVVRTLTVTAPAATYTAAMQSADGYAGAVTFRAYQLSPDVGRGWPAEITL